MRGLSRLRRIGKIPGLSDSTGNLRYQTRTMWTTDARLTGYTKICAIEVPNGSGGINEILMFGWDGANWKLAWVDYVTTTLLVTPDPGGGSKAVYVVTMRANGLVPFNTPYGYVTQRLAGARSQGDTFSHIADCLVGFTVTTIPTVAGQLIKLRFRQQDGTNRWEINIDNNGTATLYEVVTGAYTPRGSSVGAVANGNRVTVVADGQSVKVYVNGTIKITYATAANFATATNGILSGLGTGSAVADIISRARYATGDALTALNLLNP